MSSPCLTRLALSAAALVGLAACQREGGPATQAPAVISAEPLPAVSHLYPGGPPPAGEDPKLVAFAADPAHIANGKRYFTWYNCGGCHFAGGGGIGPAFMDEKWIYGGSLEEIHNSIAQGRPNGMPVWGRKIPDAQIWEIAAYVRSLSTPSAGGEPSATEEPPPAPPPTAPGPAKPG